MSKCPSCKEEIEYLFCYKIRSLKSKFKLGKNKKGTSEIYREEYTCPVCSSILAYNVFQAESFLLRS